MESLISDSLFIEKLFSINFISWICDSKEFIVRIYNSFDGSNAIAKGNGVTTIKRGRK